MNIKQIEKMAEDQTGQNPDEINFYNLDDSFINDDEVFSDNSENEFFKITLPYGNYKEDEIIKNLQRANKLRLAKKASLSKNSKKMKNKVDSVEKSDKEKSETIVDQLQISNNQEENKTKLNESTSKTKTSGLSKKRKYKEKEEIFNIIDENVENSLNANKNENDLKKQINLIDTELETILALFSLENIQKNPKEKLIFTKKLSVIYRRITAESANEYLLQKISSVFNEPTDLLKIILEFDKLKVRRDIVYSTVAKLIVKFALNLTEMKINDITDCSILNLNKDIKEKLEQILEKVLNYLIANEKVK